MNSLVMGSPGFSEGESLLASSRFPVRRDVSNTDSVGQKQTAASGGDSFQCRALIDIGTPGLEGRFSPPLGWAQARDPTLSRAAGFEMHLWKPIAPGELSRAVFAAQTLKVREEAGSGGR